MLYLTLAPALAAPTKFYKASVHHPIKGLPSTFNVADAPASQKLFGLNSTNIGAVRRNSLHSN